jgi:FkbH-like protein
MSRLYEDLLWLPRAADGFAQALAQTTTGRELSALARHALDSNQLRRLSKKLQVLRGQQADFAALAPVSIGVVSNATTKLIVPALIGTALRYGIVLDVIEAEYNQVAQEAFSAHSVFAGQRLHALLLAIDYHGLAIAPSPGDPVAAEETLQRVLSYLKTVVESLHRRTGAPIILQNVAPPAERLSGSYEGRLPGTIPWLITRLNAALDSLESSDTLILDVAGLASTLGLADWHDPTLWNIGKLAFSQRYVPVYADFVVRMLAARLGKSRRCLILDLDNTLWGGVIGDDGLEGIVIGNGNPTGEAHLELQRIALELRDRGVVLAVSSKNEDATARLPFHKHPDMLLRENHIAVFQANWADKASNIRAIAETLALGLESMVLVDDNPAERMQVRRELPEVAVPELPDDPALYARTLIAAGYFEALTWSAEDRARATYYQDNAKRAEILNQSSDIAAYLESLHMEITLSPFDADGRTRIAQLISKSNQFNLTTTRYSEADVRDMEQRPDLFTRQIRLKDVMGDNGMISVIICRKAKSTWEIDTWLMSCRVLGRRIEEAALVDIVMHAKAEGARKLVGTFAPTSRNAIVKNHYLKLGFLKTSEDEERETWELDLAGFQRPELPFQFTDAARP